MLTLIQPELVQIKEGCCLLEEHIIILFRFVFAIKTQFCFAEDVLHFCSWLNKWLHLLRISVRSGLIKVNCQKKKNPENFSCSCFRIIWRWPKGEDPKTTISWPARCVSGTNRWVLHVCLCTAWNRSIGLDLLLKNIYLILNMHLNLWLTTNVTEGMCDFFFVCVRVKKS